jgi:anti-sigma B factor antagonist
MELAVSSREVAPGCVVLQVSGELDHHTANTFAQAVQKLVAAGPSVLMVDLFDLGYMSSPGLYVLAEAQEALASKDGQLVVVGARGEVLQLLQMAGLEETLPVVSG